MPEVKEGKMSRPKMSWPDDGKRLDYKDIVDRATCIVSLLTETYIPELKIGIVRANLNPEKLSLMFLVANKNKNDLLPVCKFSDTVHIVEARVFKKENILLEIFHVDFWKTDIDYHYIKNDFPHLVYINNRIVSNTQEPAIVSEVN